MAELDEWRREKEEGAFVAIGMHLNSFSSVLDVYEAGPRGMQVVALGIEPAHSQAISVIRSGPCITLRAVKWPWQGRRLVWALWRLRAVRRLALRSAVRLAERGPVAALSCIGEVIGGRGCAPQLFRAIDHRIDLFDGEFEWISAQAARRL